MKFGFANGNPLFGNPTSTLDWHGLTGHTGEVFARLDHMPSGVFVKGVVGGGSISDGHIDDRDFLVDAVQVLRHHERRQQRQSELRDVRRRLGLFAGARYAARLLRRLPLLAREGHGQRPRLQSWPRSCGCPSANAVLVGFDTPVLQLSSRPGTRCASAPRAKYAIDDRWSVSGEIAGVPYACDAEQGQPSAAAGRADLGPAPNIITKSKYAYGVEAEVFVNYAVTPNIEIGAGLRYWGLGHADRRRALRAGLRHQPCSCSNFDQQRYGVLAAGQGQVLTATAAARRALRERGPAR